MNHTCSQSDKIQKMEIDLAVAKSDISAVKHEISGINQKLNKFTWWFITLLISIIGSMSLIFLKLKGVG